MKRTKGQMCFVKSSLFHVYLTLVQYSSANNNNLNAIIIAHPSLPEPYCNLFIISLQQVDCSPSLSNVGTEMVETKFAYTTKLQSSVHHSIQGNIRMLNINAHYDSSCPA